MSSVMRLEWKAVRTSCRDANVQDALVNDHRCLPYLEFALEPT